MTNIVEAFEAFGRLIEGRFKRIASGDASFSNIAFESEDTMRYMMFYALTNKLGVKPEFVFLEYPHPNVPAKKNPKLDTFVEAHDGIPSMVFEMKFTVKNNDKGNNVPMTQMLGALISDLIRLHYAPDVDNRFFVWVFDRDMGTYLCNRRKPWKGMIIGKSFEFTNKELKKLPPTAMDKVREQIGENLSIERIKVATVYAKDFPVDGRPFGIRVYSVDGEPKDFPINNPCEFFKRNKRKPRDAQRGTSKKTCHGGKYSALAQWLEGKERKPFEIPLDELEREVGLISPGFTLPPASRKYLAWWGNHWGNVQAGCGWLSVDWKVRPIMENKEIKRVKFIPIEV